MSLIQRRFNVLCILLSCAFCSAQLSLRDRFKHVGNIINRDIPKIHIDEAAIDDYLEKAIACKNVPALTMAIVQLDKDDNVIAKYANAYGIRDPTNPQSGRPTTSTRFALGSVSKQFTAGVLGTILKENGRGDDYADIPISELLPNDEWKLYANDALDETLTLRDLMSHRTGIPRFDFGWIFGLNRSREDIWKNINHLSPAMPQSSTFRSSFMYNNWMFMLAGYIATLEYAKLHPNAPLSYEDLIQQYIYDALGLNHATFLERGYDRDDFAVAGWYANGKWNPNFADYDRDIARIGAPAGAIAASADDMSKYMAHLLTRNKDSPGSVPRSVLYQQWVSSNNVGTSGQLFAPLLPVYFGMNDYGLGWFLSQYRDFRAFNHDGDIGEYTTNLILLPDLKTGVFLSTTHSIIDGLGSIYPEFIGLQLIDLVTNHSNPWLPIKDFCTPDMDGLIPTQPPINTTGYVNNCIIKHTPAIDSYLGRYVHPLFGELVIDYDANNENLLIQNGVYGNGYLCENPINTGGNSTYRYVVDPHGPVFYLDIPADNIVVRMNITLSPQFGTALVWWIEQSLPTPVDFTKVSSEGGALIKSGFPKLDLEKLAEVEKLQIE